MNIRDLKYIVAVAELKNFSKAADRCFVSQPTLSNQIRKAEDELGVEIFERNNKKVFVTEIGEEIIASAKRMLREYEDMKETAEANRNPLAGKFRLAAFPTLAPFIFPKVIPQIQKQLPMLKLSLIEEKTEKIIELLARGELDAALLATPVERDFLEHQPIFTDKFMLAVSSKNPLAKLKNVTFEMLAHEKILLLDEGHCLREQSLEVCKIGNLSEDTSVRATSLETLRQMVKLNLGVTLMPKIAITAASSKIFYLPFKNPQPQREIALFWRKSLGKARENLIKEHILPILHKA